MRKFFAFLLSVALGAALMAGAYEFHILRTPQGLEVIPKQSAGWREAFLDIRGWDAKQWAAHPRLVRNLTAAKREDIIEKSSSVPVPPPWFKSISYEPERPESQDELAPPSKSPANAELGSEESE